MADQGQGLAPLDPRPLLGFESPTSIPIPPKGPRGFRPSKPVRPSPDQQYRRLSPQFQALQSALAAETTALVGDTSEPDPDRIVVFEIAGTIERFRRVAQGIEGYEFLAEWTGDGIEPDEEFHFLDENGTPVDRFVTQTLYLVMANSQAIGEMIRLFELYQNDRDMEFANGLTPLRSIFDELHTIRRWGPQDRIKDTGLLEQWRDDVAAIGNSGTVRVEVELAWRDGHEQRDSDLAAIHAIFDSVAHAVIHHSTAIPEIRYHAVLGELPPTQVTSVLEHGPGSIELLQAKQVLFVRPAMPMALVAENGVDTDLRPWASKLPSGSPKAALLDGVPLGNHGALKDRLDIDDPEERSAQYLAVQRAHGTAMASLIIHGDLNDPQPPISAPLHVQPILVPHEYFEHIEEPPRDRLFVDVVHAAFERMFAGDNPVAAKVKIVNLSIGDPVRPFIRRPSPLARLIDYLAVEYNLLIVVSGGNHAEISPIVSAEALDKPDTTDAAVRSALHQLALKRRLLAPAEAINVLTVGAIHSDNSDIDLPDTVLDPLTQGAVASYSPTGLGLRRSPKPEVHAPGGRQLFTKPTVTSGQVELVPVSKSPGGPGLLTASPTPRGSLTGTIHSHGTSNAAALVTHSAHHLLDLLENSQPEDGTPPFPDTQYHPVLLRTLLIHTAIWPDNHNLWAEHLGASARARKKILTQHMGFGMINPERLGTADSERVCLIGAGSLKNQKRATFKIPLPPSLSSPAIWRRLTLTLSWLSPIMAGTNQYRVAQLTMSTSRESLRLNAPQVYHHYNGKGTVIHQVFEGLRAAGYAEDEYLAIDIDCKARVGRINNAVVFGLAATLEVRQGIMMDIHHEVRNRLRQDVRATVQARIRAQTG